MSGLVLLAVHKTPAFRAASSTKFIVGKSCATLAALNLPSNRRTHARIESKLAANRANVLRDFRQDYSSMRRSRRELPMTLTELRLMAALAIIGVTNPNAASGTLSAL